MTSPVKLEEKCWCSPLLLFIFCRPALPQAVTVAGEGSNGSTNISWTMEQETVAALQLATDGQAPSPPPQTSATPAQKPYGWHIAIYPALAWVPIFGASVTLPSAPSQPIATPGPSGSTSSSLNGAFFGGARFEKGKWSADGLFMWTALSAQRKNPLVDVNLDFVFGNAMAGREMLPNLYVEGGVRRLALDIHATVESSSASRSPGFWDSHWSHLPSTAWQKVADSNPRRRRIRRRFRRGRDRRGPSGSLLRHFGIAMGYGGMHFSVSDTVNGRTVTISPTLHGPIFGFGIFF